MLYLSNIDLNKNQLQNAQVHPLGTAPSSPVEGQIYFDSTVGDKKLYYYNGTQWIATGDTDTNNYVTAGSISSGTVTLTRQGLSAVTFAINNNQITNGAGYITSASLPTVGNGTLTVQGTGVLGGTGTFTANQSGNTTISVTHDAQSQSNTTPSVSLSHGGTFTALSSNVGVNSSGHVTGQTLTTFTLPTDGLGVETVTSGNTNTITIGGTSADPTVAANTAAVVNGGASLATGNQIYDFVTGQIANIPSGLSFEGSWNANTDTPDLSGLSPENGQFWIVSVAGSTDLDGITDWEVGDWAIYVSTGAGTDGWQKVDNTSTLSGAGTAGQLTYWTGTANVAGDAGLTYNAATDALTVGGPVTWSGGGSAESNSAYDNMITALSVAGTTTKTLTATQQDGGTLTASWTDTDSGGTVTGVTGVSPIAVTSSSTSPAVSITTATASAIGAGNVSAGTGISVAYSGGTATVTNTQTNSANTYAETITDTDLTIDHGLNTTDVMVQLFDITTGETVYADVDRISAARIGVTFASTPTNSIRVLVQKIG